MAERIINNDRARREVCQLLEVGAESNACKVLTGALYAAGVTIKDKTERTLFVQDFSASLSRHGFFDNPHSFNRFQEGCLAVIETTR